MKLHLECERTIHFQKVDGTQGVLKEGAQAYMHFITSKKIDIWMRATVLELHDEGLRVRSDDGLRWNFFYSDLKDVSIAIGSHRKPHGTKLRVKDRGIVKIKNIVDDWRSKT